MVRVVDGSGGYADGVMDELMAGLLALDLEPVVVADGVAVRLPSERRGSFVLLIAPTERALAMRAFVMRAPDRRHEAVYRRLLAKNLDAADWRFALDEWGDVYLTAYVPQDVIRTGQLDGLLGGACAAVDAVFEGIARTGFDIPDEVALRPPSSSDEV